MMRIIVELNNLTVAEYDRAIERNNENPYGLESAIRLAVLKELESEISGVSMSFIKVIREDRKAISTGVTDKRDN